MDVMAAGQSFQINQRLQSILCSAEEANRGDDDSDEAEGRQGALGRRRSVDWSPEYICLWINCYKYQVDQQKYIAFIFV